MDCHHRIFSIKVSVKQALLMNHIITEFFFCSIINDTMPSFKCGYPFAFQYTWVFAVITSRKWIAYIFTKDDFRTNLVVVQKNFLPRAIFFQGTCCLQLLKLGWDHFHRRRSPVPVLSYLQIQEKSLTKPCMSINWHDIAKA